MTALHSLFGTLTETILDAIFPRSEAEVTAISLSPEAASALLPAAPALPVPMLPGSAAIFAYKDERVARLVWNIKYKKHEQAVKIGGFALYNSLVSPSDADIQTFVIPMPITQKRRRERGFNQCELLTDEVARLDTFNMAAHGSSALVKIIPDLLLRSHHSSRQTLKGRTERLESAKGIFSVDEEARDRLLGSGAISADSPITIIDDVITTGSTMKEAIDTMRAAGFTNIRGLSLAH